MESTNQEIGEEFSKGNFSFCYNRFSNDIEWKIIGNKVLQGKENVIAYCEKMTLEMDSSALINTNIIAENNQIAIEGICKFTGPNDTPGEVAYCDVFRFKNGKISNITSYCI